MTHRPEPFLLLATSLLLAGSASRGAESGALRVTVMVELRDEPAAVVYARETAQPSSRRHALAAAQAQVITASARQEELLSRVSAAGIDATPLYRLQRAYNGVALEVDAARLEELARMPGVRAVHRLQPELPENASSGSLIGAPSVWALPGGLTGEGVTIALIDSGIDYLHTDLGGPGTGYAANDTTVVGDVAGFPNARVVGGFDLAGDEYDASSSVAERRVPHPDPDPMDCGGHGTHVAGTAAGSGVTSSGAAFGGPYGPGADLAGLRIGPGVAPRARILSYRVFGCTGSSYLSSLGVEWALDPNGDGDLSDHADVINLSLGTKWSDPGNPVEVASDNASLMGVLVARSAGNDGDVHYAVGGRSLRSVLVGSSVDSTDVIDALRIDAPADVAGLVMATATSAFAWKGMASPVQGVLAFPSTQSTGCSTFDAANRALLDGKVALLDWTGSCGSAVRVTNAADAGARGVVLVNTQEIVDTITGAAALPGVLVPKSVGDKLKPRVLTGVTVTFDKALLGSQKQVDASRTDTLSSFSSRGPSSVGSALRPDVAAPGQSIFSAAAGTGNLGTTMSGTSMASPQVAGALALLRQLHRDWSPEEIKALLMSTATHDVLVSAGGLRQTPSRTGTGRIDLLAAAQSSLVPTLDDSSGRVSASFGAVEVLGTAQLTQRIRVENKGTAPARLTLALASVADAPGVSFSLPGGSRLDVPAGSSATFDVQLSAQAAQMKHVRNATLAPTQGGQDRQFPDEAAALLTLTPEGGAAQRLVVHAVTRPAGAMSVSPAALSLPSSSGTVTLQLSGQNVNTGSGTPPDVSSIVSLYELSAASPDEIATSGSDDLADLRAVGVRSSYPAAVARGKGLADTWLAFGVALSRPHCSPLEADVNVFLDTNLDGVDDWLLFNNYLTSTATDVFVATLCPLPMVSTSCKMSAPLNHYWSSQLDTAPFNTSVLALPVSAADLGLSVGHSRFRWHVVTFHSFSSHEDVMDETPVMTYDAARPGFALTDGDSPVFWDSSRSLSVAYDRDAVLANGTKGILLLHHQNTSALRAEIVAVTGGCDVSVAETGSPDPVQVGQQITYTVTVANAGPWSATAVVLTDVLPQGASLVSATPSVGSCAGTGTVTCALGTLAAGDSATVTVVAAPSAPGTLVNRVSVQHAEPDTNAANDTASETSTAEGTARARLVVPIVLDVVGRGGARFTSELLLGNRGTTSATVTLAYTAARALGATGSGTATETLAPGHALLVSDAISWLRGKGVPIPQDGSAQGGSLTAAFEGLSAPGAAFAMARTTSPSGNGRAGLAYMAETPVSGGPSLLLFGLRENDGDRSNLALVNAGSDGAVTLRITLHDGAAQKAPVALPDETLAPGEWRQLNAVLSAVPFKEGWAVVERVSGSQPFMAYAVFNDNVTSDGSFVAAVPSDGRAGLAVLPVLVETSTFRSELVLANPTSQPMTASLAYVESLAAAEKRTGRILVALHPGEQLVIPDAIQDLRRRGASVGPRGGSYGGALMIQFRAEDQPGAGLAGARTGAPAANGGQYGLFYPAVPVASAAREEAWVFGLVQDGTARSNMAVVGCGDSDSVTLRYEVFDGSTGAKVGTSDSFTLGPGGWRQFNAVLAPFHISTGYVRVFRVSGTAPFLAYGVVNDGADPASGTNDGSYVPMASVR